MTRRRVSLPKRPSRLLLQALSMQLTGPVLRISDGVLVIGSMRWGLRGRVKVLDLLSR